jgi:hypothetical protein
MEAAVVEGDTRRAVALHRAWLWLQDRTQNHVIIHLSVAGKSQDGDFHSCVLRGAEVDAGMAGEQLANADAKRTVLRLKQKLEGLEGGAL